MADSVKLVFYTYSTFGTFDPALAQEHTTSTLAEEVGVEEAIIIANIQHWFLTNTAPLSTR